ARRRRDRRLPHQPRRDPDLTNLDGPFRAGRGRRCSERRMSRHEFVIVDVFTDVALAGNQLAVFTDASAVPDDLLQPLAREIGFSETVFVYAGDRVRIFTPSVELPFAGHPVLGTAYVLATSRGVQDVELVTGKG